MLTGSLSEFPLLGILQMLLNGGRTGRLQVMHPRGGELWLEGGEVVHALSLGRRGLEALSLLASVDGGEFSFDAAPPPAEHSVTMRRDALLQYVWQESEAWPALLSAFPDWGRPVRFAPAFSERLPVTRAEYRALSLVGRGSLAAMVGSAPMPPRHLLSTLQPLLQARYIELG